MKRDGNMESLWQHGMEQYQPVNQWNRNEIYDVLIVGGGITGLTTALLLQQSGKKCVLAEADNIGFGTTGGTTAHLNTTLDSSYDIIEKNFSQAAAQHMAMALNESLVMIEKLITQYNIDCDFSYRPAFFIAETIQEQQALEQLAEATNRAGIAADFTPLAPTPITYRKACRIERQAQLHATKYIYGLAKAYEQEGGVLLQYCMVNSTTHDEYFTADTSLGEIKARKLVYATHIPPGVNLLHFRCAPYRSYAAAFTLRSGEYPEGLVYDLKDPYHYFRTQEVDGKKYLIAGGCDHKTGDDVKTQERFRELEAYLHNLYDIDSIDYKWSSQYFNSADGLPYIGLLPGHTDTYTATGYSGNGMILGSLAGIILCDLLMEQPNMYADLLSPSRIKPIAGFKEFVKENADVISKFIGMRFSYEKVSQLAELAPGDAVLAKWEDKKVALYKDDNGKIHALDPVCPHAGCLVAWNNAEKSWDCPCHGSRFSCNGTLLTGPARKGLTSMLWEDMEGD